MSAQETHDIRELLGSRTTVALITTGAFIATYGLVAVTTSPPGSFWHEFAAWLIISLAAVTLVTAQGDPLPTPPAILLAGSGVVAANLVFLVIDPPVAGLQLWPLTAATAVYTYMFVRGRALWGWIGMIGVVSSCMLWAERNGLGYLIGLQTSMVNLAPVVMATFFVWRIRPAVRQIFELREQATLRVAAEAADKAVLEERNRRLIQLDDLARPLLERLAGSDPLTEEDRLTARLLEAHLRDTLRAPALATPAISAAINATRSRGVEVVMLDDSGLDHKPDSVRKRLLDSVRDALDGADTGTLTIRVLPPHRDALLTILHSTPESVTRLEFGHDGNLMEPPPSEPTTSPSVPLSTPSEP
ncbi:hypothetical protein [Williamsia soli]|uniref:hypothetical protein n=1 Tax=Williamsia soli TaxID=364929 RepID=UPI001A9D3BBD|nr:hypothetical protein [Williamsia soli]